MKAAINFVKYERVAEGTFYKMKGKVVNIVGLTIESLGPEAKLGDICLIYPDTGIDDKPVMAEVVGFRDKRTILMPYEVVEGIGFGCMVENTGTPLNVQVSDELLGQTLDGLGRPINR